MGRGGDGERRGRSYAGGTTAPSGLRFQRGGMAWRAGHCRAHSGLSIPPCQNLDMRILGREAESRSGRIGDAHYRRCSFFFALYEESVIRAVVQLSMLVVGQHFYLPWNIICAARDPCMVAPLLTCDGALPASPCPGAGRCPLGRSTEYTRTLFQTRQG